MISKSYRCIISGLLLFFCIFVYTLYAQAVWEHAPISETTRFPKERSATWEFGMVFNLSALYPANFSCPGGARVILHILNISPVKIIIQRVNPKETYTLLPGTYRKIDFGKLQTGEHLFFLDVPVEEDIDPHTGESVEVRTRMKCFIRATRWPGSMHPYRTAWIMKNNHLFPNEIILPAGRNSDIFIGSSTQTKKIHLKVRDYKLVIKPGKVTLTEIKSPAGGQIKIALPHQANATLTIR